MSIINGRSALGRLHMPPSFERGEHHEHIGCAIALIFVVGPRRLPFLHRHRRPRFCDELLAGFVQTDQRTIRITRPRINLQHVFHRRDEAGVCFRRDHPLFFEMRLEFVFFKTRQIVLSLARSTMLSSTTLFSSSRKLQRARPFGGSEHANAISLASFSPSKIGVTEGLAGFLRLSTASTPSSTSCWRVRYTVVALVSSASTIRLSLQPSPPSEMSAFNKIRAFISFCAELFPLRIISSSCLRSSWLNRTTNFFTATSLADMVAPVAVPCDNRITQSFQIP